MLNLASSFGVIDSHTAGHPTRVILSGIPKLDGASVLEKREDFRARFDYLRPLLLHEPRGHAAMVGLVPVASTVADYGAFFILLLCLSRHVRPRHHRLSPSTLASTGQIAPEHGDSFTLETPAGVVTVGLDLGRGRRPSRRSACAMCRASSALPISPSSSTVSAP